MMSLRLSSHNGLLHYLDNETWLSRHGCVGSNQGVSFIYPPHFRGKGVSPSFKIMFRSDNKLSIFYSPDCMWQPTYIAAWRCRQWFYQMPVHLLTKAAITIPGTMKTVLSIVSFTGPDPNSTIFGLLLKINHQNWSFWQPLVADALFGRKRKCVAKGGLIVLIFTRENLFRSKKISARATGI